MFSGRRRCRSKRRDEARSFVRRAFVGGGWIVCVTCEEKKREKKRGVRKVEGKRFKERDLFVDQ